jgi:UDP-galactopyranose mutase
MIKDYKYVIVGSGFYGSVIAERIANDLKQNVLVIDKNPHIGGKCYSEVDKSTGIEYHKYGTHIFHTSNKVVWHYIQNFTEFNSYYHQVLTTHKNRVYQMPINLETINSYFNVNLKPFEVEKFMKKKCTQHKNPASFEEFATNSIGLELYNAFIKGYTQKQWETDPRNLPAAIIKRLPVRSNYNESYFFDRWQGIPLNGYTAIFNKILTNERIKVLLNTNFSDIAPEIHNNAIIIYSGAIDEFFNYKYGKLDWRSLNYEQEVKNVVDFQGTSVMNYADIEIPYTRIHEYKHLHPERDTYLANKTLIVKEYSCNNPDDPVYPINDDKNNRIFILYRDDALKMNKLVIGGRLGDYKYYDMDKTIEKALQTYENIIKHD